MTAPRPVSTALENMLVNNEPFQYAHLVKFERPDGTFTYITDASRNVTYNGNTYLANKLISVGAVSETTKASASNTSIVIDGNALGSEVTASATVTSGGAGLYTISLTGVDFLDHGFREGDKILVNRSGTYYTAKILSFPTLSSVKVSSSDLTTFTGQQITITLSSEEIISILMDKTSSSYSSFVNRQVDIYKAYFQEGVLIGAPLYLFKGAIYNVNFEDSDTSIRVSWGLTSQWGDFSKVNGRITSDSFHRALDSSGIPQPDAAIRPEYATDLGFQHSESNINMLTKYIAQVEDFKIKKKKTFGIVTGVKIKKFYRPEERFTDLNFNLQASSIPVIYGVRTSEGIPVFADTLKDDSGKVYVAYVLSEGEIGGILDLYVEGQSLICSDEADSDARDEDKVASRKDDSVAVLCRGRADRGDALVGTAATDPTESTAYNLYGTGTSVVGGFIPFIPSLGRYDPVTGTFTPGGGSQELYSKDSGGLGHDETLTLTSPQNIKLVFYTGKSDQEACPLLKTISDNQEFKIQTTYAASSANYWSVNHRLLDTAYVVAEFKIAEGETTIPEIEYVIRGKYIDCYNYDQSYEGLSGDSNLFNVGDTVTFSVGGSAMIIDKFKFKNPDGTDNVRFRWDNPPSVTGNTTFSMSKGGNVWTMGTYLAAGDRRVSINPAIQLLDYITSTRYGRGLSIDSDIDLPSWTLAARKCDKRSDVTIKITNPGSAVVGGIYRWYSNNKLHFQGKVASISGNYVTFTDVIGKITNKWNSWKSWQAGEILYTGNDNNLYVVVSAGVKTVEPSSANAAANGLSVVTSFSLAKVGGGTSLGLYTNMGNVVQALNSSNQPISGYSLYDSDSINYWKMCGWDAHDQRYVTKYQTNIEIDTSQSIFDNINALLEHFNGILRYTEGKYYLEVEEVEPAIPAGDVRNITKDDIIGKIQLSDEGVRSAYNSLVAAFADPAIKFEPRNIGFFNSDYLTADRNVPKKGNISVPGITNYYNTRLLAESYLNKSRFGLTINMTLRPSGILLLAGKVIEVTYPRYGWNNKPFRIESMNMQPDCLVDIVAKEYDDSFYQEGRINRTEDLGLAGSTTRIVTVGPPTDLIVTSADTFDDLLDGVELFWKNNPRAVAGSVVTEVYGSKSPELYLNITSITSNVLTCSEANHYLIEGMPIFPEVNYKDDLLPETVYYVKEVLSNNQFTLTDNRQTNTLLTVTPGSGLSVKLRTATLLATVPVPGNSYFDTVPAEGTNAVEKYYWVRHKVIE